MGLYVVLMTKNTLEKYLKQDFLLSKNFQPPSGFSTSIGYELISY